MPQVAPDHRASGDNAGRRAPRRSRTIEPVEINAGQWYLRGLRADERIDDRPALAELGVTDPDHVARSEADWSSDARYSWAVCEPTTGELLAEVTLDPATGDIAHCGHDEAAVAAAGTVRRFAANIVAAKDNSS